MASGVNQRVPEPIGGPTRGFTPKAMYFMRRTVKP